MHSSSDGRSTPLGRRQFIRNTATGLAATGLGLSALRAGAQAVAANDRIGIGLIGVGGRGSTLFGELWKRAQDPNSGLDVLAVCDVWDRRVQDRVNEAGGRVRGFRDYRELLQLPDLDAVTVATPDHWHSRITIDAMRAGKDVYCEKPLTLYWEQAKEVLAVSRETGRIVQCGAGSASDGNWWTAQDIVRAGGLGPLVWTQGGVFRNDPGGDWNWGIQPADPNKDLDWDLWLGWEYGLAPKIPYDPERFSRFRKYWDYSGGLATDLLYHTYAHLCIGLGNQKPFRVMGSGAFPVHGPENDHRETPTIFHILADFPTQHTLHLVASQEQTDGLGDLVRGQKASLSPGGPGLIVRPQDPFRDEMAELAKTLPCYEGAEQVTEQRDGKTVLTEIRVRSKYGWDHIGNWLQCIRSREQPTLNAERAYITQLPISLSVRSFREQRVLMFDPEKDEVT